MEIIRRHSVWLWAGAVLILIMALAAGSQLPVRAYAAVIEHWLQTFGLWGIALFVPCYIGLALVAPITPLTVLAGFAFGLPIGLPVVLFSAGANATLTFLFGRYLIRQRLTAAMAGKTTFQALDKALVDGGWRIILLSQMSPFIPFNLQNLFYGLSHIPLWVFVPATLAGILPGAVFYVYLGAVGRVATHHVMGPMQWVPIIVGLVATALFLLVISRAARLRLSEISKARGGGPPVP